LEPPFFGPGFHLLASFPGLSSFFVMNYGAKNSYPGKEHYENALERAARYQAGTEAEAGQASIS